MGAKSTNKVIDLKASGTAEQGSFKKFQSTKRRRIFQIVVDLIVISGTVAIFGVVYKLVDPKIRYFYCNQNKEKNLKQKEKFEIFSKLFRLLFFYSISSSKP